MKKAMIGYQIYSAREDAEKDLFGTLKKIAEMGYDGVEFAGFYHYTVDEIKKALEESGLVAISAHVPLAEIEKDMFKTISDYKAIGCKYIAVPYTDDECRPGGPRFAETIRNIYKFGRLCREAGIQLLYHNHDFEFVKMGDEYGIDVMYSRIPADLLQTELDTCWVNVAGEDPAAFVLKYSGRAPVVHLKDFYMPAKKPEKMYALIGIDDGAAEEKKEEDSFGFRPVGYGAQNIPAIIEASEKAGAKWLVVEQDDPSLGKTPMECAKMSIDYLHSAK